MLCQKCGKEIPDDSKFCSYCGANVSADTAKNSNNKAAPYGRCGRCGEPLDADDSFVCKKCLEKEKEHENSIIYMNNGNAEYQPRRHKTKPLAIVLGLIALFFTITIIATIINSPIGSDETRPAAADDSAAVTSSDPSAAGTEAKADLELLSSDGTFDSSIGAIHITGSVKNNSEKTFSYVQIQFVLYDKSGAQVGTALANTNGLEPGNIWKYDAIGMASNVSTFKASNLVGY